MSYPKDLNMDSCAAEPRGSEVATATLCVLQLACPTMALLHSRLANFYL